MEVPTREAIRKMKRTKRKKIVLFSTAAVVLWIIVGFGSWSFYNYQQAKKEVARLSTLDGQRDLQQKEGR